MASKPPTPKPTAPDPFAGSTRATVPMPIEKNSESAWQLFEALRNGEEPAAGHEATEQMELGPAGGPAASRAPQRAVSLEDVLQLARRNNRACPLPAPWAAFYELLPARTVDGRSVKPPASIDRAGWTKMSAMQKRLRLRDQIEWAERAGVLQAAYDFLANLPEAHWHHFE
ncbi:hypothetical protein EZ313_06330 [Ramlibacter henchirensis]|uniref:Uncharacterized protein n=1 Tax=Ramlibacter henchirensis TaxID=204072 RepID=A0A4Z0C797_9BURK|nr:hypothetical protein [Ramlibacter henchirensis]TFZ06258.1 hypothetical protein EZ313_06330 [Ramlibacter henchirensis]